MFLAIFNFTLITRHNIMRRNLESHAITIKYCFDVQQPHVRYFLCNGRPVLCYSHQEADTEMLYALDVSRNDPFTEMVVSCWNTDVLLTLRNYWPPKDSRKLKYWYYQSTFTLFQAAIKLVNSVDSPKNMFGNLTFSSSDVLKGFARLGSIFDPCEDDLELFEKFLLNLCCKNKVPSSIQTLAELGTVLKPVNFCWTEIDTSVGDKIILILIIINILLFPLNMQYT